MGGELSPRGRSPRPLTKSLGGGRRASAWGERESARRQAVRERGGTRRRGGWWCGSGDVSCGHNARRIPKEEEAGLLHPEVGNCSPNTPSLRGESLIFLSSRSQGDADRAPTPSRPPRC
jgi:hypothetical protein